MLCTLQDINKRGAYKRKTSKLEAEIEVFYWTDADGNGSISPQEWANFYSTLEDGRLPKYSYNLWLRSFYNQITEPGFDKNNNSLMELGGKFNSSFIVLQNVKLFKLRKLVLTVS